MEHESKINRLEVHLSEEELLKESLFNSKVNEVEMGFNLRFDQVVKTIIAYGVLARDIVGKGYFNITECICVEKEDTQNV